MKIRIKFGDEVLTATMLDTETSRDFVAMLPLKLRLTDYGGAEKISDLPRKLSRNKPLPVTTLPLATSPFIRRGAMWRFYSKMPAMPMG